MDTGSEGILFSRQFLGNDVEETNQPFSLIYTSSNNTYSGTWVIASVTFSSAPKPNGAVLAKTVRMRVRAVDEKNEEKDPKNIMTAMIGVGFDRDTSPGQYDPAGHCIPRDINPFLQLEDMISGDVRPGFILDWRKRAIVLGLTDQTVQGYIPVPLIPRPYGWTAPLVHISLPDAKIDIHDASLLMDCGIGNTIVQAPDGVAPPLAIQSLSHVVDGQRVRIYLSGLPRPLYAFTSGDAATDAPAKLLWGHKLHDGLSFVNTGRHALEQFDYMFDAEQGVLGIRFANVGSGVDCGFGLS